MELSNSEGKNFSVSTEVSVLLLDVNDEVIYNNYQAMLYSVNVNLCSS